MNCWAALLLVLAAATARAEGDPTCSSRAIASVDGQPVPLDDCSLWRLLQKGEVRRGLRQCVLEAERQPLRVYGGFGFQVILGLGAAEVRAGRSAFDRTGLPACLARVLRRRLAALHLPGKVLLEGRFLLRQGNSDQFAISLTGDLIPERIVPPPLPGRFTACAQGVMSWCPVGDSRMVVRLDSSGEEAINPVESPLSEAATAAVAACREAGNVRGSRAARGRKIVREPECLGGLLFHADLEVSVAAAEALAQGRFWSQRFLLTRALQRLVAPDCPGEGCPVATPPSAKEGLLLLRLAVAHKRLRQFVPDEVLEALARHPSAVVRTGLVGRILGHWSGKLPAATKLLLSDSDPHIRMGVCELGCQREDPQSEKVFLQDIRDPKPEVRAGAILYAGTCARHAGRQLLEVARAEPEDAIAMLMLLALPAVPEQVARDRAGKALFHPCPAVRFLAARLLVGARIPPDEQAGIALAREPNQVVREELTTWSGQGQENHPERHKLQIWLQPAH